MAKLLDPNHDPQKNYMVRMSHAISEHRGLAVGLCLLMLLWFGIGGYALQDEAPQMGSGSGFVSWRMTSIDWVFWGACAGALITLVAGWSFFHKEMAADEKNDNHVEAGVSEEIQKFKQETTQSRREARLKRLNQGKSKIQ